MKFESQDYGLSAIMSAKSAKNATPLIDALKQSIKGFIDEEAHKDFAEIPISDYKISKPGTEDFLVTISQTNFDLPKDLIKRCPLWTAPQLIDDQSSDHGLRLLAWLIMREMHYMIFFSQKLTPISFNKILALMMSSEACDDTETQIAFRTMLGQLKPTEPKALSKAEEVAIAIKAKKTTSKAAGTKAAGKKAAEAEPTEKKAAGKKAAVAESAPTEKKAVVKKAKAAAAEPATTEKKTTTAKKAAPAKKVAAKKAKEPEPEEDEEEEDEPEEVDSEEEEEEEEEDE